MSSERVPPGQESILLELYYKDGFCTVQAIWDGAQIRQLEKKSKCLFLTRIEGLKVYVTKTPNSEKLEVKVVIEIAKRWIAGDYVTVQPALFPNLPPRDWMS